jgi:hypothetical protein
MNYQKGTKFIMEKAIFGAGCFWGVEADFRQVKGVISTAVGYEGGTFPNPTYRDVCSYTTGHAEVVEVDYDRCPGYLVRPFLKEAVCTHVFLFFYLKGISRAPCKVMNCGKQVRFRQIFVKKAARNCDDKDFSVLNSVEFRPNIRDNHQFSQILVVVSATSEQVLERRASTRREE